MMMTGTVLCQNREQEKEVAAKLSAIEGVNISESELAIAIDFAPTETMTSLEENRALSILIDLIESVKVHGLVISP